LLDRDGAEVGVLAESVDMPQATVSRRLRELYAAGLLEHVGRKRPYGLRVPDELIALLREASELAEQVLGSETQDEREFRHRLTQDRQ
jgi:DNA-binding transcriptional ArsR family regulator